MKIKRCVCFGKKFSELKKIADKTGSKTIAELQEHVRFGLNCRRCHPYVKEMLKSGQTVFEHLLENDENS